MPDPRIIDIPRRADADNIVVLHRGVRPIPVAHLERIYAEPVGKALDDETPTPIDWPSFYGGLILGVLSGLLAVALPAIVIARVVFGEWL